MILSGARAGFALAVIGCVATAALAARLCRARRRLADAELAANTDELTGLGNRRALLAALDAVLRTDQPVALLLLDLDGFKSINDTYGHGFGDLVLRVVAHRMTQTLGHRGPVSRLGGDEFATIVYADDPSILRACTDRVRAALTRPIHVASTDVLIGVSIGCSVRSPADGHLTDLLHRADVAMYQDKKRVPGSTSSEN